MLQAHQRRFRAVLLAAALCSFGATGLAAQRNEAPVANWELAEKFSTRALDSAIFSTSVNPSFILKTDSAWYRWRDQEGIRFMLLIPQTRTKVPLFDHVAMAESLSQLTHKPFEPTLLPIENLEFTDSIGPRAFRFQVDSTLFRFDLATARLTSLGPAPADSAGGGRGRGGRGGRGRGGRGRGGFNQDFRNFSPDSTAFVFARDHNLFLVEVESEDTVQLSTDGVEDYSFGARDTTQTRQDDDQREEEGVGRGGRGRGRGRDRDPRVRANANWSEDSQAFYITRTDQREVEDLYLIDMLNEPRPRLVTYKYPMPGEEHVRLSEVYAFDRGDKSLERLDQIDKWTDQSYSDIHFFGRGSDHLRLIRRDRPRHHLELIDVELATGDVEVLVTEEVEGATLEGSPVGISPEARYIRSGEDFLWWSERTGWGHFYLYGPDGTLKNAVTSGPWRAESIEAVDSVGRVAWIRGTGREPGENVYHEHLYRVNLDGSGIMLLDAGDADHSGSISPSRRFVVDNYSRPDLVPKSVLRDARGNVLMELEQVDVSRLEAMGWSMPEPFVVKAADGVTDIYGNLWKPFDFDPTKKYPIIANVYPGPQTESVSTTFSASNARQELAQLGFIVIQIGNRGGSPQRSNAYQSYSYQNLRDYGLADKKAGIEQLAARYPWIDLDRVGIFGHSGGGFMTAAAMLVPPYNEFFKVGVASSGNHDNNVYGDYWAEQNHGLTEVVVDRATVTDRSGSENDGDGTGASAGGQEAGGQDVRFEIHVPANHELAANLKGNLLLVHGDMDNNVHPAGTIRLVNALIEANKRFDFMVMPGAAHGYGDKQPYFQRMLMEYFAEHLLGDYYGNGAEIR